MQECVAFLCHPVPLILPCHPSARCPQDPGNYAHTFSCHCERSEAIQSIMHARMRDFIMTGSPRSRCSLAMTKSTTPSSPPLEGCRAAAGWSEKPRQCHIFVIASHRRWRGNLFCIVVFHNVSLGRLCALCVSSYLFKLR